MPPRTQVPRDTSTLRPAPLRAWTYHLSVGCVSLGKSLPCSGLLLPACNRMCCAGRTQILSFVAPTAALSGPFSLGKMLLVPVQLGQGPRGRGVTLVFWEGRHRHSSSSGWTATIQRSKCWLRGIPREEGACLFPGILWGEWGRNGNQTQRERVWKGASLSRPRLGRAPGDLPVSHRQGEHSCQEGPSRRGTSAQGEGDQALPLPSLSRASGYFLPPAVCLGSLPGHGTLPLLPSLSFVA